MKRKRIVYRSIPRRAALPPSRYEYVIMAVLMLFAFGCLIVPAAKLFLRLVLT